MTIATTSPRRRRKMSSRKYTRRLKLMQMISTLLMFSCGLLQGLAMATTDWYVLNVNEYIPTAKGGLWHYCFVSSPSPSALSSSLSSSNSQSSSPFVMSLGSLAAMPVPLTTTAYACMRYEELPNFAVFVTSRLYDSRVMLVCSAGFALLMLTIETVGVLILCFFSKATTTTTTTTTDEQHLSKPMIRPRGYFTYLAISLITLVGSVMDFVLKVSGFALFDSYMTNLLAFNTVFLAYRSYSYWIMIASMAFSVSFWLFKVFSTKYVINLTKQVYEHRQKRWSAKSGPFLVDGFVKSAYDAPIQQHQQHQHQQPSYQQPKPPPKSFMYECDYSNITAARNNNSLSSYWTAKSQQNFYQDLNSNYFNEAPISSGGGGGGDGGSYRAVPVKTAKPVFSVIRF